MRPNPSLGAKKSTVNNRLIHISDLLDAIADWKAPYEVAETLGLTVKQAEAMLRSVVRLRRAEYGKPNNTYRAIAA